MGINRFKTPPRLVVNRCVITFLALLRAGAASAYGANDPSDSFPQDPTTPSDILVVFRPGANLSREQRRLAETGATDMRFLKRVIPTPTQRRSAVQNQDRGLEIVSRMAAIRIDPDRDFDEEIARINALPTVEWVEPDAPLRIFQSTPTPLPPNDPSLERQWHLNNIETNEGSLEDADIDALEAWTISSGNPDVVVAVIDTGIDFFHPDLEGNHWINAHEIPGNGLDDDANGFIDDVFGYDFQNDDSDPFDDNNHGTHVAGILAARGANRTGGVGVAWNTNIMALKVFDQTGSGRTSTAIEAIDYAVANGARLINASWGTETQSRALREVVDEARQRHDVLIIAAAGNDNQNRPTYPAAYPNAIAVAALNAQDQRASFSNYGPWVAVAAPGEKIYSTKPNNDYGPLNGTSMATPIVAGVAALTLDVNPEFTSKDIENILLNAIDPLDTDQDIGAGRINARKAVAISEPLASATLNTPSKLSGIVDIEGVASGESFASYSVEIGEGEFPSSWRTIEESSDPVEGGRVARNVSLLDLNEDASYAFRLSVRNAAGAISTDTAQFTVDNVRLDFPLQSDLLRAGDVYTIKGAALGQDRTYLIEWGAGLQPTDWSAMGVQILGAPTEEPNQFALAQWDTSDLAANQLYTLRLSATDSDGAIETAVSGAIYLDSRIKSGWPVSIPIEEGEFPKESWRAVQAADLDGDGTQELIAIIPGNDLDRDSQLLVLNANGDQRWTAALSPGGTLDDIPVIGDLNGDGQLEIFADSGRDGLLHRFDHQGAPMGGGWPIALEATRLGKVIADINADGELELITLSNDLIPETTNPQRQLTVYRENGAILRQWSVPGFALEDPRLRLSPAVANLDDDPELEIFTPWGRSGVALYELSASSAHPTWTSPVAGQVVTSPVIGDLDNDGANEAICVVMDPENRNRGGIHVWTGAGERFPGFPAALDHSFESPPALADLDGDRNLEIIAPSKKSKIIRAVSSNGFDARGWGNAPRLEAVSNAPVSVGALTHDGRPAVLLVEHGQGLFFVRGDANQLGGVRAWSWSGLPIRGNSVNPRIQFPYQTGFTERNFPTLMTDLDGDGRLDIVQSTVTDWSYFPEFGQLPELKNRGSIIVWETSTIYDPEKYPWPTYQQNVAHTGSYKLPPKRNAAPEVIPVPGQVTNPQRPFFPIDLDRYVADPNHGDSQISWRILGADQLTGEISGDRVLTISLANPDFLGVETWILVATDPAGESVSQPVRFEVTAEKILPEAQTDRVTTLEDTPVDISVLENDSDPNGEELTITSVGAAANGFVSLQADSVRYSPEPNFHGTDSFFYTVRNPRGGQSIGVGAIDVIPVNDPPTATRDRVVIDEDETVGIDALRNDRDVDGDSFYLAFAGIPSKGSVTVRTDGSIEYTPSPDTFGSDGFNYIIRDTSGLDSVGEIDIVIRPVNDRPVVEDIELIMNRNTTESLTFRGSDVDGDDLEYEIVDAPVNGLVSVFPDVAEYDPKFGFVGKEEFTYRAFDGSSYSQPGTISVEVLDQNNPPRPRRQSVVTLVNQPIEIELEAQDPDEDAFEFLVTRAPTRGDLVGEGSLYIYTPDQDFVGADNFSFTGTDGQDQGAAARVDITVTDKNTPPVVQDQNLVAQQDKPLEFTLEAQDPEGASTQILIEEEPQFGILTGRAPEFIYTPASGYLGPDRLRFRASDGVNLSEIATVFITVEFPNDAPVAEEQSFIVFRNETTPIPLPVRDPDGDPLRSVIVKGPKNGLVFGSGTSYFYRPNSNFTGADSFTFRSWDSYIYSSLVEVELTVRAPNPRPAVKIDAIAILANDELELTIHGRPGSDIRILKSVDLQTWETIATESLNETTLRFRDALDNAPAAFYRAENLSEAVTQ